MTLAEQIAKLTLALDIERRRTAYLHAKLMAEDLDTFEAEMPPAWTENLCPGSIAVMTALLTAHPKAVTHASLEEVIPKQDHTKDRDLKIVAVHVCNIRKVLGRDAIQSVWGRGYRCGDAFAASASSTGVSMTDHARPMAIGQ